MGVQLTILGSGTSHGVPMIGCDCAVCTSSDPRDRRMRASAVFTIGDHNLLVDTGPELRLQCVASGIRRVDAILYTHAHADHIAGLDDVRRFNWLQGGPVTVYGSADTLRRIRTMFAYAFEADMEYPSAKPQLEMQELRGPIELCGARVTPVPLFHGELPVYGYRVGRLAYCTDCNQIPAESRELLRGLDVLVLDALRRRPHPTHFNLEAAVAEAQRIGARRTVLTHIAHELGHDEVTSELPAGIELAFDGLVCTELDD